MSSNSTFSGPAPPGIPAPASFYSTPPKTNRRASSTYSPHDILLQQQQSSIDKRIIMRRRISQGQIRLPDIKEDEEGVERTLLVGKPDMSRCDNELITSKYTVWNFFPLVSSTQQ